MAERDIFSITLSPSERWRLRQFLNAAVPTAPNRAEPAFTLTGKAVRADRKTRVALGLGVIDEAVEKKANHGKIRQEQADDTTPSLFVLATSHYEHLRDLVEGKHSKDGKLPGVFAPALLGMIDEIVERCEESRRLEADAESDAPKWNRAAENWDRDPRDMDEDGNEKLVCPQVQCRAAAAAIDIDDNIATVTVLTCPTCKVAAKARLWKQPSQVWPVAEKEAAAVPSNGHAPVAAPAAAEAPSEA